MAQHYNNHTIFNFWHSGALALSPERQSARMSKIKNGGLDQYGAGSFKQQQFGTAGVEGVNVSLPITVTHNPTSFHENCWWLFV